MEPIIRIKYYTEDSEMRAMIDMYWALNESGTHRYKSNDFVKNFGINTHRLHYHIKGYYEAYCIYDKCCECDTVSRFLKKRQDRYKKKYGHWQCYDCAIKDFDFREELPTYYQSNEHMEEAFIKGKHHDLSTLQLRIFKALINENYYSHLNEQFGMSKVTFLRHVYELQSLNLLKFDQEVDHVFILDEYKCTFR